MVRLQGWFQKYNAWSYTKHRLWNDCKRAYYFNYIGAALQDSIDIDVAEIKKLKKLDGRFIVQGKIIHEIVEKYIKTYQNSGIINEKHIQDEYIRQIEQFRTLATTKIVEYFNGAQISQFFFDKIRENGLDQLSLFWGAIWPQISSLQYLRHEQFDNFYIDETKAIVKVDYVCKSSDGKVLIYDWKTGLDNDEYESDLQVGAYALWASLHYQIAPETIECNLVYLTSGSIKPFQFTVEDFETFKSLIKFDFEEMNSSYEINQFPPSPSEKKCLGCQFATICDAAVLGIQEEKLWIKKLFC